MRVAVRRPRRGGTLRGRRRPDRHGPSGRRPGRDRRRRPHPPALAPRCRPVAGAGPRPPRHGLAAGIAGDAPVVRGGRRGARPRLLRHEGRSGHGLPRPGGSGRPRRRHGARDRGRGARLAVVTRAHRGGGPDGVRRAGARGLGRRRRPQDRAQGGLAVRRPRARPGRARGARARAGCQRHPRAGSPGAGRLGAGRAGPGHHRHAHRHAGRDAPPTPSRPRGRSPSTSASRPSRSRPGSTRPFAPCAPSFPERRWRSPVAPTDRRSRRRRRTSCSTAPATWRGGWVSPNRRPPRSAGRPTATSPPASARRPWTDSAPSAAAPTPTTSTSLVDAIPGRTALLAALVADLLARPTHILETTGVHRP